VDRSDVTALYHAGSLMQTTKLLAHIRTYIGTAGTGAPVTDYQLDYQYGNAPYYQLMSVKRCDGAGNCLAPTTFGWQTATDWSSRIVIDSTPTLPAPMPLFANYRPADFNGDGLPDGVGIGDSSHLCQQIYEIPLSLGVAGVGLVPANMTERYSNGVTATACLTHGNPLFGDGVLGDIDGDGFTDVFDT